MFSWLRKLLSPIVLPCCCPDGVDVCCCDIPVSTVLTWDDGTNTGTLTWNGTRWVGTGDIGGCTGAEIRLTCMGEPPACFWDLNITGFVDQPPNIDSPDCDPFELVFSGLGCDGNPVTITITA